MSEITYDDKVDLQVATNIANINKVTASDMNEIKNVVNGNADEVGDITSLTTTDKTSVVNAVNELNAPEKWVAVGTTAPTDGRKVWFAKGKNLFNKDEVNVLNGFFNSSTTTITSGSDLRTIYIPCKNSTTYTISKMASARFSVGYTTTIPIIGSSVSGIITNDNATSITITTSNNATYLLVFLYREASDTGKTLQDIYNSVQIEESTTATTYEPYVEKTINIDDEKFIGQEELVSVGVNQPSDGKRVWFAKSKNLINLNTITTKSFINSSGLSASSDNWSRTDFIKVQPNTTYTLSGITNTGTVAKNAFYSNQDVSSFVSAINSIEYTFTTPNNANYVRLSLNSETPTSAMLEEGSTASSYEPYVKPAIYVDGMKIYEMS